jgi:hypothetical protein
MSQQHLTSGGGATAGNHMDERQVAKQALDHSAEQARDMCQAFSTAFVAVERRGITFQSSLANVLRHLDELAADHVETLHDELCPGEDEKNQDSDDVAATPAATSLKQLSSRHRLRRRTLLQHSTLMELLELSNVMDACIRSQLYDDALHIASIANTLERRHDLGRSSTIMAKNNTNEGGGILVVANVVDEIRAREVELRHFLIQQFKSDITMPQCLELVTALRRLNGIELERRRMKDRSDSLDVEGLHLAMEMRLQVDFLEARDKWLEKSDLVSMASARSSLSRPNDQLLDWIERQRTKGFEIATQFISIFCNPDDTFGTDTGESNSDDGPQSLLSIWCARRIQSFLSILRQGLDRIKDAPSSSTALLSTLHDVMDASIFLATSFGRIGCDFSPLLFQLLEEQIISIMTNSWDDAVEALKETLRICRDAGVAEALVNSSITVTENDRTGILQDNVAAEDSHSLIMSPPRCLLKYPPLARFINSFLTSLNDLRRCLMPGTFDTLQDYLLEHVCSSLELAIETNERKVMAPRMHGDTQQLRQIAPEYKHIFAEVVKPFVVQALDVALGNIANKEEEDPEESNSQEDPEESSRQEESRIAEEKAPIDVGLGTTREAEEEPVIHLAGDETAEVVSNVEDTAKEQGDEAGVTPNAEANAVEKGHALKVPSTTEAPNDPQNNLSIESDMKSQEKSDIDTIEADEWQFDE